MILNFDFFVVPTSNYQYFYTNTIIKAEVTSMCVASVCVEGHEAVTQRAKYTCEVGFKPLLTGLISIVHSLT
jgi:hypothetical protein